MKASDYAKINEQIRYLESKGFRVDLDEEYTIVVPGTGSLTTVSTMEEFLAFASGVFMAEKLT